MQAVEQVLLYWSEQCRGKKILINVDNPTVAHSIENETISGAAMTVLRRCLLLAAEHNLKLEAKCISTK